MIRSLDPTPRQHFLLSITEPHHSFEIWKRGKVVWRFEPCFTSENIRFLKLSGGSYIDGGFGIEPDALLAAFESTISSLGLRTRADWRQIARESVGPTP